MLVSSIKPLFRCFLHFVIIISDANVTVTILLLLLARLQIWCYISAYVSSRRPSPAPAVSPSIYKISLGPYIYTHMELMFSCILHEPPLILITQKSITNRFSSLCIPSWEHPWWTGNKCLLSHGPESFSRSRQLCCHSRTSQHFMEPEGSMPCSREPSTFPILRHINPIHAISLRSILILSTHLHLGLPSGLFPSDFHANIL
jgi:hypothetical protein